MIGGAGGKIENGFIFSAGTPFENYFFPGEGLLRFIFSWGRPFEIYFFLEKGFQDLFSRFPPPHPRPLMVVP